MARVRQTEQGSSRDRVLHLLESRKGTFFSGEEIASELGISRTAVWKAVRRLRDEGCRIDAVTNRGYRLSQDSDILSAEIIRQYMEKIVSENDSCRNLDCGAFPTHPGKLSLDHIRLEVFETIDSTNTFCLKKASEGERGGLIAVAGRQSMGRGRRGRSFFSPEDTGLYMSILLRPFGVSADMAVRFTTIAAVAVAEAIEAVCGKPAQIKWVNDIYVNSRKVCGILTEASFNLEDSTLDYAVVCIGINVYEPSDGFPENIKDIAGALQSSPSDDPESNTVLSSGGRNRLAAEVITRFYSYCIQELRGMDPASDHSEKSRYIDEYRRRCFVIGREIEVFKAGSEPEHAVATGIDDECRLIVTYADGRNEVLGSGEISIRL